MARSIASPTAPANGVQLQQTPFLQHPYPPEPDPESTPDPGLYASSIPARLTLGRAETAQPPQLLPAPPATIQPCWKHPEPPGIAESPIRWSFATLPPREARQSGYRPTPLQPTEYPSTWRNDYHIQHFIQHPGVTSQLHAQWRCTNIRRHKAIAPLPNREASPKPGAPVPASTSTPEPTPTPTPNPTTTSIQHPEWVRTQQQHVESALQSHDGGSTQQPQATHATTTSTSTTTTATFKHTTATDERPTGPTPVHVQTMWWWSPAPGTLIFLHQHQAPPPF